MKISYTPEAIGDLKRLKQFVESRNPQAAKRIAANIKNAILQLKVFPFLGVEVHDIADFTSARDLIMGKYTVRYWVNADELKILRIWHHKEDEL